LVVMMRILVIGGTGFIGRPLVQQLAEAGHAVTVLHRGSTHADLPAEMVLGDRRELASLGLKPEIVIDLILSSGAQAQVVMNAFRGVARRVVAASSIDVYRACAILHGSEEGPLEPVPLTENSPLRTKLQTYPPAQIQALKAILRWMDDEYDKIPVERNVLSDPELPGVVLRLPMIYGPGDYLFRLYPLLKRMDDHRPAILFEEGWAAWRSPRGYVENVAAAVALAAVSEQANGVYNVAEEPSCSELEWAQKIASAVSWPGEFVIAPKDRLPSYLAPPGNSAQHWSADSTRIRRELAYCEPVGQDEAIHRTIAWQREHPPPTSFGLFQVDYAAEDAALS
jgi:nucleoside-diphosphate-sugar epimerase